MEEAKYLPTTALSFFLTPQNLCVTTLDEKGGGLFLFDIYITVFSFEEGVGAEGL